MPPGPGPLLPIIDEIMATANSALHSGIAPLVLGSLVSFAFVFAHPFMDGNGRLSRFLFHRVVCASGMLPNGMVLPVSVAMKRNENRYLAALQSFSKPAREARSVTWIAGNDFDLEF
ncbi:MAG: Fic family protein [Giesbergeria sp.]|nr:Fic family protein [Giesbergeria sp.]